jgi:hypothetical protein
VRPLTGIRGPWLSPSRNLRPGPRDYGFVEASDALPKHRQGSRERGPEPTLSEQQNALTERQLRAVNLLAGPVSDGSVVADCDSEAVAGWSEDNPEFIAELNRAKSYSQYERRAAWNRLRSIARRWHIQSIDSISRYDLSCAGQRPQRDSIRVRWQRCRPIPPRIPGDDSCASACGG